MRKSAWGTKKGREVVLAIWVKRSFFEDCLGTAVCSDTFGQPYGSGGGSYGGSVNGSSGPLGSSANRPGSFASNPFPPSGRGGGADGGAGRTRNQSPDSRHHSPASSGAGSPPVSPASEQLSRKQLEKRGTFALGDGGGEEGREGAGSSDAGRGFAGAGAAAAVQAKGKSVLTTEDEDGDNDSGEDLRGRAVTGDPSTGTDAYFGGDGGRKSSHAGNGGGGLGEGAGGGRGGGRRARSQSLSSPTNLHAHSGRMTEGVRLHWEPERLPSGEKVIMRARSSLWIASGHGWV